MSAPSACRAAAVLRRRRRSRSSTRRCSTTRTACGTPTCSPTRRAGCATTFPIPSSAWLPAARSASSSPATTGRPTGAGSGTRSRPAPSATTAPPARSRGQTPTAASRSVTSRTGATSTRFAKAGAASAFPAAPRCARAEGQRFDPTASFSFLRAATFAVFDAGRALNTVGSPVNGFVPSRAFRAFTSFRDTLMNPGRMVTGSPLRTLLVTTSSSASSTAAAVRFSTPAASATARSSSVFVIVLLSLGLDAGDLLFYHPEGTKYAIPSPFLGVRGPRRKARASALVRSHQRRGGSDVSFDGREKLLDRRPGCEIDRRVHGAQRELVVVCAVSRRWAGAAVLVAAESVSTVRDARNVFRSEAAARRVDPPCDPVGEGAAGRTGIFARQRELDDTARHAAPIQLGRRVGTVAGVLARNWVAFFEVRAREVHRRHDTGVAGVRPTSPPQAAPASARASRATRRASWSGTGVRAASVDAARTISAAVSAFVRHAACATTGRAPVLVHTQNPTHRSRTRPGARAPRSGH